MNLFFSPTLKSADPATAQASIMPATPSTPIEVPIQVSSGPLPGASFISAPAALPPIPSTIATGPPNPISSMPMVKAHIDDGAKVDDTAIISSGCYIQSKSVIGANVYIEPYCIIGPEAIIAKGVNIGENTIIKSAVIGEGVNIGQWNHFENGVSIGNHAQVANYVSIKKITHLGEYSCVESRAEVPENAYVDDRGMVAEDGSILKAPSDPNKRYALWNERCVVVNFT